MLSRYYLELYDEIFRTNSRVNMGKKYSNVRFLGGIHAWKYRKPELDLNRHSYHQNRIETANLLVLPGIPQLLSPYIISEFYEN